MVDTATSPRQPSVSEQRLRDNNRSANGSLLPLHKRVPVAKTVRYAVVVTAIASLAAWVGYKWAARDGVRVVYVPAQSAAEPTPRYKLSDAREVLHKELVALRTRIETLTQSKTFQRPKPPPLSHQGAATGQEVLTALDLIKQDLADLALTANRLKQKDPSPSADRTLEKVFNGSDVTERLDLPKLVRNRSITVRNLGSDVVVNPRIIVNGQKNWFDVNTLLDEILSDGMSDREKAIAIWRFLTNNRLHGQPSHVGIELHDPVRFLNVYGFGYCDDAATNLTVLAEHAGLKARVVSLGLHIIAEVFFDGDWHVFDPDGKIYYLDDDGQTIASLKTLEGRADIIRKHPSPFYTEETEQLVAYYTSPEDNTVSPWYSENKEATHTMRYILRPGESLMRSWDNWGLYFSGLYLAEPERYGNGRFSFEPIFEADLYKVGAESSDGLTVGRHDGGWFLTTDRPDRPGVLTYGFHSPYPFLSGALELTGTISEGGRVEIEFSEHGSRWRSVRTADKAGRLNAHIPLRGYFRNGYGSPTYNFFVRLTLASTPAKRTHVDTLRYTSDVQLAPHALPTLQAGKNSVRYLDDNTGTGLRNVEVVFQYDAT